MTETATERIKQFALALIFALILSIVFYVCYNYINDKLGLPHFSWLESYCLVLVGRSFTFAREKQTKSKELTKLERERLKLDIKLNKLRLKSFKD